MSINCKCLCYQVKYWLEQLAGELQERLTKEAELVRFDFDCAKGFGSISGATISFISSQRQGSKPSNFAILLVFLTLTHVKRSAFQNKRIAV